MLFFLSLPSWRRWLARRGPLCSVTNAITAHESRRQCRSGVSRVRPASRRSRGAPRTLSISVGNVGRGEGLILRSAVLPFRARGIAVELCSIFAAAREFPARGHRGNVAERPSFIFMPLSLGSERAGYFKLIFEMSVSGGGVAHPSELARLPFYFGVLLAFNVRRFGSEPSDTMSKTSRNITV